MINSNISEETEFQDIQDIQDISDQIDDVLPEKIDDTENRKEMTVFCGKCMTKSQRNRYITIGAITDITTSGAVTIGLAKGVINGKKIVKGVADLLCVIL